MSIGSHICDLLRSGSLLKARSGERNEESQTRKPTVKLLNWTKAAEGKTLLSPKHSLYAFLEPINSGKKLNINLTGSSICNMKLKE